MSKYNAKKTTVDGIVFASKKEAQRYAVLKVLQKSGVISDLRMQVPFVLIPEQREPMVWQEYRRKIAGRRSGRWVKGKLLERPCVYVADFVYTMEGETVVEDVKGVRTDAYRIKRKLMLERYNIQIKEV